MPQRGDGRGGERCSKRRKSAIPITFGVLLRRSWVPGAIRLDSSGRANFRHRTRSSIMADPPFPVPSPPPHHADSPRLARGIRRCLPLAARLTGVHYRVASVRRANPDDLVAGIGSLLTGGRWTPPGAFRAVYASRDEVTALDEARQQNLRLGVPTWMALPLVVTALELDLEPVLDLTDGRVRRALRVSGARMLSEPWWTLQDRGEEALTQAIGRLARDQGFVGLLAPSAARREGTNAVVFPDRLGVAHRLSIVNPDRLPSGPA
jgi:RES domain-containing protein